MIMGIISWIILGALAGWIASIIMKTNGEQGALANIIVGIVGAVLGGYVFAALGESRVSGLNLYSLIVATSGALIVLFLFRVVKGRHPRA